MQNNNVIIIDYHNVLTVTGVPVVFPVVELATLATGNNYLIRENE